MKMERNRMAIAGHNTILSVLPAYWLRRDPVSYTHLVCFPQLC